MTKFLGILSAVVVGSAMCGAARAGDWCDYPPRDHDSYYYDHGYGDRGDHFECRSRLPPTDCGDFRYRDWLPRRQSYVFWSPADHSWYYWCTTSRCYLPYDQFDAHPSVANVVPEMPRGLPPVVPGGIDRDKDEMPPVPPDDAPIRR